jgi:D-amino peptidase
MKVFISADIEGTTGIASWDEAKKGHADYSYFSKQMTAEVVAAVRGSKEAGACEVLVRDAHGSARNIDPSSLPEDATLLRGWARDPFMMMQGIDESFDAVVFTGYHSPSGTGLNPLSHTMTDLIFSLKINGVLMSEFALNAMTAAHFGVPVVFLSGDAGIASIAEASIPGIETVVTNMGRGASVAAIHPSLSVRKIEEGVFRALSNVSVDCMTLPANFDVEITYIDQKNAYHLSFFPGVEQVDERTLQFAETDYYEVLRKLLFLL